MTGLKRVINERGLKISHIARELDITYPTFWNYVNGVSSPSPLDMLRISKYLNVSLQELFFDHLEEDGGDDTA